MTRVYLFLINFPTMVLHKNILTNSLLCVVVYPPISFVGNKNSNTDNNMKVNNQKCLNKKYQYQLIYNHDVTYLSSSETARISYNTLNYL